MTKNPWAQFVIQVLCDIGFVVIGYHYEMPIFTVFGIIFLLLDPVWLILSLKRRARAALNNN